MRQVIKIILCAVIIVGVLILHMVLLYAGLGSGTCCIIDFAIWGSTLPAIWKYEPKEKRDEDDLHTLKKD